MALTFGAQQVASSNPLGDYTNNSGSAVMPLIGAGLGVASALSSPYGQGATSGTYTGATLPWMQQAYQTAIGYNQAAAARTSGQAVAGLTPAQQQAMQGIQNSVGYNMPAMQQAQNMAGAAAAPVGSQQINNFMNPFTQNAVNSTLATMNQQQQQGDANVNSQANMAGAFGGDRSAVAQNLNDQTWDLDKSNVVANLNNQGYQSAVNSALQSQGLQQSGAANYGAATAATTGANTQQYMNLLGVGNQQQTQNQNVNNWAIQQGQIAGTGLTPAVGNTGQYAGRRDAEPGERRDRRTLQRPAAWQRSQQCLQPAGRHGERSDERAADRCAAILRLSIMVRAVAPSPTPAGRPTRAETWATGWHQRRPTPLTTETKAGTHPVTEIVDLGVRFLTPLAGKPPLREQGPH